MGVADFNLPEKLMWAEKLLEEANGMQAGKASLLSKVSHLQEYCISVLPPLLPLPLKRTLTCGEVYTAKLQVGLLKSMHYQEQFPHSTLMCLSVLAVHKFFQ